MSEHVIEWKALREQCQKVFVTMGISEQDAFVLADCMVYADLSGVSARSGLSGFPFSIVTTGLAI